MPIPGSFNPASIGVMTGGYYSYEDEASKTVPQSVLANTVTVLENDSLGALTSEQFAPVGIGSIWNSSTSQFDFNQLGVADTIEIRLSLDIETSAPNQEFRIYLVSGIGGPTEFDTMFTVAAPKNAGSVPVNRYTAIFMGSPPIQQLPSEFRVLSEGPVLISNVLFLVTVNKRSV